MLALWIGTQKRTITKTFSLHPIVYAPMFFFIGAYYAFAGSGGGLLMTFALFWLMKTTNLKDVIASRLIIGLVINFCFVPFAIFYGRIDWLVSIIGFISALIGGYI